MSQTTLKSNRTSQIEALIQEIEPIPDEYLSHLLQIIRLYRKSITIQQTPSNAWKQAMSKIKNPDPQEQAARQKALSELLRAWEEEDDEQEQKETWEQISKTIEEGVSI